jgi:hypothetical protein
LLADLAARLALNEVAERLADLVISGSDPQL